MPSEMMVPSYSKTLLWGSHLLPYPNSMQRCLHRTWLTTAARSAGVDGHLVYLPVLPAT